MGIVSASAVCRAASFSGAHRHGDQAQTRDRGGKEFLLGNLLRAAPPPLRPVLSAAVARPPRPGPPHPLQALHRWAVQVPYRPGLPLKRQGRAPQAVHQLPRWPSRLGGVPVGASSGRRYPAPNSRTPRVFSPPGPTALWLLLGSLLFSSPCPSLPPRSPRPLAAGLPANELRRCSIGLLEALPATRPAGGAPVPDHTGKPDAVLPNFLVLARSAAPR